MNGLEILYAVMLSVFWLAFGALGSSMYERPRAYRQGYADGRDGALLENKALAAFHYSAGKRDALRERSDDYEAGVRAGLKLAEECAKTTPRRRKRDPK